MDDKAKLYVFEKKEVFLIFLFMIIVSLTSFVLGVRIGKDYSFKQAGYTKEDKKIVDLYSAEEEKVNKVVSEIKAQEKLDLDAKVKEALEKKFEQEFSEDNQKTPVMKDSTAESTNTEAVKTEAQETVKTNVDAFKGKYTIQLGSRPSLEEAEEFAYTFKIRGYDPIINEATIEGRGTWYRVSIGVFDSVADAKTYIDQEDSLFQGQEDSFVVKFD